MRSCIDSVLIVNDDVSCEDVVGGLTRPWKTEMNEALWPNLLNQQFDDELTLRQPLLLR